MRSIAGVVERTPESGDAAVHHVARRDDVGPCLGMADGRSRQELQRQVVHDLVVLDDAAVPVARVLAEADVRHEDEAGRLDPERPERSLDDAVVVVCARANLVLVLGNPEKQDCSEALGLHLAGHLTDPVDRTLRDRLEPLERTLDSLARADEERENQVGRVEAGLAD